MRFHFLKNCIALQYHGKAWRRSYETQPHFYPMNLGTSFALPGPPSDRGWARQPFGEEEGMMTLQQAGEGSPSRAFHWAGVHEYRKKGSPLPSHLPAASITDQASGRFLPCVTLEILILACQTEKQSFSPCGRTRTRKMSLLISKAGQRCPRRCPVFFQDS